MEHGIDATKHARESASPRAKRTHDYTSNRAGVTIEKQIRVATPCTPVRAQVAEACQEMTQAAMVT